MTGILATLIGQVSSGGAPPVTSDPYFEYTTLLLPGNGTNGAQNNTFLDGSTNNFTITRNGNTTQGTFSPFSQTGWGNYFDGTNDYLRLSGNSAFDLGSGDFTIEAWVYTQGSGTRRFVDYANGTAANSNFSFFMTATSGNVASSGVVIGSTVYSVTGTTTISNAWTHVALVRYGTGSGNLKLYVNGTEEGTAASLGSSAINTLTGTPYLSISSYYNGGGEFFNGNISNLRIVKGTAVYTGNFTPSTTPLTAISGTSLLTCQSNRFIDNSSNNFTITANNGVQVVAFSPFNPSASWSAATYGGSGYFDGTGDFVTAANNTAFDLSGSISWCIELWAYWTNTSGEQNILEKFATTPAGWTLYKQTTGAIELYNGSTTTSFSTVVANQWYHIVLCRDNATNTFSFYLNGTRTSTSSLSIASNAATALVVGARTSNSNYFNGYMSGLRIVKGSSVYDPSQSTLTVPTSPPTNITNTSLLLNFANAGIYDATSKNDLETVNNAQVSTTISAKFGSGSMKFNGTNDFLRLKSSDLFAFGTGDFTVEAWAYRTATTDGFVFDTRDNGVGLRPNTSNQLEILVTYAGVLTAGGTWPANQWVHIAATRTGGNIKLWLDGTNVATAANSTNMTGNTPFIGSANGSNYFPGYIQDLRITKGYARYTANFTPPTAAFPTL